MLKLIRHLPAFLVFRYLGKPVKLPLNLTLSVTYRCNSRCKTCNVYTRKAEELSLDEWDSVFTGYGKRLFWATISGGEPFLRNDLADLVCRLYDRCTPAIINIPTNGLLTDRIVSMVRQIAAHCSKSQIIINVSLDGIGKDHDMIRGVSGGYERAVETFIKLKSLENHNLSVGIHTVISVFNVDKIPMIHDKLVGLGPDSYITEIAEQREELQTMGTGITPSAGDYEKAIDYLLEKLRTDVFGKVGRLTRAFRILYYQMVKRVLLEKKQIIPCYSGFASAQIAPDGDIWMCCMEADVIGNLRNDGYDFKKIWISEAAKRSRARIKKGQCHCTLANASYTNMLFDPGSIAVVIKNLLLIK